MVEEEKEKIKRLVEFRKRLEQRIQKTKMELEELQLLKEFLDLTLLEKGFKQAEVPKPSPAQVPTETITPPPVGIDYETVIPLKTVTGEMLANLYVGKGSLKVVVAKDKKFNVTTPPFMSFLVEKVLAKMQEKDREAASMGKIAPEKIFSYTIERDGDLLHGITIRNFTPGRLRELKSSIRWTLEKMFEKQKRPT